MSIHSKEQATTAMESHFVVIERYTTLSIMGLITKTHYSNIFQTRIPPNPKLFEITNAFSFEFDTEAEATKFLYHAVAISLFRTGKIDSQSFNNDILQSAFQANPELLLHDCCAHALRIKIIEPSDDIVDYSQELPCL